MSSIKNPLWSQISTLCLVPPSESKNFMSSTLCPLNQIPLFIHSTSTHTTFILVYVDDPGDWFFFTIYLHPHTRPKQYLLHQGSWYLALLSRNWSSSPFQGTPYPNKILSRLTSPHQFRQIQTSPNPHYSLSTTYLLILPNTVALLVLFNIFALPVLTYNLW